MDPASSRIIALAAARKLVSLIDADGRFLYRYDSSTGAAIEGYHTTRHAAAIWGPALAARELDAPELLAPLQRAMHWLIEHHVRPIGEAGLPAIVEDGRVDLGGAAMALLAALALHRALPDPRFLDLARHLGAYLLSQRRADGEFIHRRAWPSGEVSDHRSRYSTPQALLALAGLYGETGDGDLLAPALESAGILAAADFGVREQGHWMLYAIEALEAVAPRTAHRAHAGRIAGALLVYPLYRTQGASNPIACYSEALAAYLRLLRSRAADSSVEDFPSEALVRPALEENLALLETYRLADGAFSAFIEGGGVAEVQIDHIQHPLAAHLNYSMLYAREST
jgi:hypothetical protein